MDSWLIAASYRHEAVTSGLAAVITNCEVTGATMQPRTVVGDNPVPWRLHTSKGDFDVSAVVNCAGNYADAVQDMGAVASAAALDDAADAVTRAFTCTPRKGQYVVMLPRSNGSALVNHPLQPLPTDTTKGVRPCLPNGAMTPLLCTNWLIRDGASGVRVSNLVRACGCGTHKRPSPRARVRNARPCRHRHADILRSRGWSFKHAIAVNLMWCFLPCFKSSWRFVVLVLVSIAVCF